MSVKITGRALHYVLKIGDRAKNSYFFREILGMKVLRHEEFKEGCEAQCNGPYDNRWSKTMIGYGDEADHFVVELTYNYGIKSYELGNDFGGITIKSKDVIERARAKKYPISSVPDKNISLLTSPDGYKFYVEADNVTGKSDPVVEVCLNVTDLAASRKYWHDILGMQIVSENADAVRLTYGGKQATLCLQKLKEPLNRAKAYGRIAFAVPKNQQPGIDELIKKEKYTILTELISLDTPGKATVRVIILADPDGHEICFVDEEGFGELSKTEADAAENLDKNIKKDPFQDK